jgi:hypothetical protein
MPSETKAIQNSSRAFQNVLTMLFNRCTNRWVFSFVSGVSVCHSLSLCVCFSSTRARSKIIPWTQLPRKCETFVQTQMHGTTKT